MRHGAACPKCCSDERNLSELLSGDTFLLRSGSVDVDAVGALGCECDRKCDHFGVVAWDFLVRAVESCLIKIGKSFEGVRGVGADLLEVNEFVFSGWKNGGATCGCLT